MPPAKLQSCVFRGKGLGAKMCGSIQEEIASAPRCSHLRNSYFMYFCFKVIGNEGQLESSKSVTSQKKLWKLEKLVFIEMPTML